jgi:hypothetical protein
MIVCWHCSGNFWWADCQHIAALPPMFTRFDAWSVEYWLMNVSRVDDASVKVRYFAQVVAELNDINHLDVVCSLAVAVHITCSAAWTRIIMIWNVLSANMRIG